MHVTLPYKFIRQPPLPSLVIKKGGLSMIWTGWSLARIVVLLIGVAYLMISLQVTMFHYRQNFRNPAMWVPVISGPIIGLIAVLLALINTGVLLGLFKVLLWIAVLGGMIGFFFHFRGIGQRVDGYVMRNFLIGPPLILPLMFSAMAVFGLFAVYWR